MKSFHAKIFGAIPSPPDPRDYVYGEIKPVAAELPSKFLLDEWQPVNDQGEYGTCVGQACSAIKDWQESYERGENIDTSPLFVYSLCKKIDGIPNKEGTTPRAAMKVLTKHGICFEKDMPYHLISDALKPPDPPGQALKEAKEFVIKSYARVQTLTEIKQAIKEDGPVLAAILWASNMSLPENGFVPMPNGFLMGGHAVVITGWDDELEHTYKQSYKGEYTLKGFFRVRNSWGPDWGDGGYCWMSYKLFTEKLDIGMPYLMEAWTTVDQVVTPPKPRPKPEPTPDPKGKVGYFDVPPTVIEGRTMLEVRELAKLTGAEYIDWKEKDKEVILYYPSRIIYMNLGEKEYRVVPR